MKKLLIFILTITAMAAGKRDEFCGCIKMYAPVCATDYKTYPNKCEMSCENGSLRVVYNGECGKPDPVPAPNVISLDKTPPSPYPTPNVVPVYPPSPYPTPIVTPVYPPSPYPLPIVTPVYPPSPYPLPIVTPVYPPSPYPTPIVTPVYPAGATGSSPTYRF